MSHHSIDPAAMEVRQSREYRQSLDFLYQRINYERRPITNQTDFRLRRMRRLMDRLGNPDRAMKIVHIAGTKGKGSTASMVAAMLQSAGETTGLYTSPHLQYIEDRWRIDGVGPTPTELIELVDMLRPLLAELDANPRTAPTFFELTTAMAFLRFRQGNCSWAAVEVGLGGRLDSTNIVQPKVTAITTIGLDHQAILGDRVELIAAEKAGIIKRGVPIISGVVNQESRRVIEEIAASRHAPLRQLGRDFSFSIHHPLEYDVPSNKWDTTFEFIDRHNEHHTNIELPLAGDHQAHNAALALEIMEELQAADLIKVNWDQRRCGLLSVTSSGRLQRILGSPEIILDVAHNVDSIAALVNTLQQRLHGRAISVVFACSGDKDGPEMVRLLGPLTSSLILTRFHKNPRCSLPESLGEVAESVVESVTICDDPHQAFKYAAAAAGQDGVVVVCGSFFLVAEVMDFLEN